MPRKRPLQRRSPAASGPPGDVLAAHAELVRRFLIDVHSLAMAAEAGTHAYGFENIVGVGISRKTVGSKSTTELGVTVYVVAKAPRKAVAREALIPKQVDGVPTDVVAIGELHAQPYRGRYRPAPGGVSVGHFKITAGTLGCLVRSGRTQFMLSNNHVLADSNAGSTGDPILQPGSYDGGQNPRDAIARLSKFVPIQFGGTLNYVDCAIAELDAGAGAPRNIAYGKLGATPVAPKVNLLVKKAGRTTQATRGRITDVNFTGRVGYGTAGTATFAQQFIVRAQGKVPFSAGGDSGSLIMTQAGNKPVGLLFAGSETSGYTIANPIARVLADLGVTIVV